MDQDKPRIQKRLLRRALRRHNRRAAESERNLIQLALRDEAIFEPLYDQTMSQAKEAGGASGQFVVTANSSGALVVDNLLKLLQWFVDHGPELVKVIELIVGLFGGAAVVAADRAEEQCIACRGNQSQKLKEQM